jgi:hypothetical protein
MLGPADTIGLSPGVRVENGAVTDDARGARFPVNDTGLFVLHRAGRPLGEIARELALQHGLEAERARADVLRFAFTLNRAQLVNVHAGGGVASRAVAWLRVAVRLAPAGMLPSRNVRRFALDTSTPASAVGDAVGALRWRSVTLALAAVLLAAPGGLTPGVLALGLGVGGGLVAHEAGHAALLTGVAAALVIVGLRTFVIHPTLTPARRRAVATAGPAGAVVLGVAVVCAAWASGAPELGLAGCAPAAHAIGLTVATGDGRAACGL